MLRTTRDYVEYRATIEDAIIREKISLKEVVDALRRIYYIEISVRTLKRRI